AQMGANQGDVWVWSEDNVVIEDGERQKRGPNGGPGQFNGGAVVLGGRPTYDPAADWYYLAYKDTSDKSKTDEEADKEARAIFDKERGKWMDEFDPWGVALEMSDNTAANAWVDVRNMQAFVLRNDSTVWENIVNHPQAVQWVNQFKGNMGSDAGEAQKEVLPSGGTAIQVLPKQDRVAHWGSDQALNIPNPQTIRAVLVSVEARISDKSDPDAKLGIQVGGDWKFTDPGAVKPFWYPGAGLAGIQRLSRDWARYYFVSITGVQDAIEERAISQEVFMNSTVPLADMEQAPQSHAPQSQAQQPASAANGVQAEKLTYKTGAETVTPASVSRRAVAPSVSSKQLPKTGSQSSLWSHLAGFFLLGLSAAFLGWKKNS
ncbi:LPXTG cell wall anchor domain-containing protein, partial [Streptococcus sp. DD11]|uniref:LPXTG cell wall anchor domain-containing protein n=1 Tax=Streptococcus sp. DD11 TaxID=1777879 RepID=UPI001F4948B9